MVPRSALAAAFLLCGCYDWDYLPSSGSVPLPRGGTSRPAAQRRAGELSGGTLAIAGGGHWAVATDPDSDRVWVVDLTSGSLHGKVQLPEGSRPERIVEDGDGRVRVAL